MAYLLNLVYLTLLAVLSPWLLYRAAFTGKYRQGLAAKLLGLVPRRQGDRFCVWLHAVSVGEVNLIKPLVDRLARQRPDWECVISTTTRTGYALAKQKYDGLHVIYCPLDFSWAVAAALRRIRPSVLLLAELELWPNLVRKAKRRGAHVGIVNARLSQRSYRGYRRLRPFLAGTLRRLDLIAAQNEEYAERFLKLGARPESVEITGSLKFDDAQTDRRNAATQWLRQLAAFQDDDTIFLAGSTQQGEEKLVIKTFQQLSSDHPRLRLVLVPRHAERFEEVAHLLDKSGLPWQRRTELALEKSKKTVWSGHSVTRANRSRSDRTTLSDCRILLVDTIGELAAWWGTADIAFVGGSLGRRGGQNMIEPAAYGAAVCFGPNTRNFKDTVAALLHQEAAVVVKSGKQLTAFVTRCLQRPEFAKRLGKRAQTLIARQQGATEKTLRLLERMVKEPSAEKHRRAA